MGAQWSSRSCSCSQKLSPRSKSNKQALQCRATGRVGQDVDGGSRHSGVVYGGAGGWRRVAPKAILGKAELGGPAKGVERAAVLVEQAVCARDSSAGPAVVCTSTREVRKSPSYQTEESGLGRLKRSLWLLCGTRSETGKPIKRRCEDTEGRMTRTGKTRVK